MAKIYLGFLSAISAKNYEEPQNGATEGSPGQGNPGGMTKPWVLAGIAGFLLILLASCTAPIMTPQGFENIQLGIPIDIVEAEYGSPYEIENLPNGFQEYTYIQRIPISPGIEDQVTYTLYVCQGRVASKLIRHEQSSVSLN